MRYSMTVTIDKRGVVYLGAERYLAGEQSPSGKVTSYVPGHCGPCASLEELVRLWEAFKGALPSYSSVTHPDKEGGCVLEDAQRTGNGNIGAVDRVRLREIFGKDERQAERARKTNGNRKRA